MSSTQKKGWIIPVAFVGLAALVGTIVWIMHEEKKKKENSTTTPSTPLVPAPSTNGLPTLTRNGLVSMIPTQSLGNALKPIVPLPPTSGCGCVAGVGYGSQYGESHPLENVSSLNQKGCKNRDSANYDSDDRSVPVVDGCMKKIFGCTDERAWNYNKFANTDYPGACWYPQEPHGCTDKSAFNYDPKAKVDNGSCIPRVAGCTSIYAANYNPHANTDDGSCIPFRMGCTSPEAANYNPDATVDDNSCVAPGRMGCGAISALNYDRFAAVDNGTCCGKQQMMSCNAPSPAGQDCAFCLP